VTTSDALDEIGREGVRVRGYGIVENVRAHVATAVHEHSVRCVPRPRRSSRFKPAVPRNRLEFDWLNVLRNAGKIVEQIADRRLAGGFEQFFRGDRGHRNG